MPLKKIGELSSIANIPYSFIRKILFLSIDPYRSFKISKRDSKLKRIIYVPQPYLLIIQSIINKYILQNIAIHPIATAYYKGANPLLNARYHCNPGTLIKLDIKDFFHSFDERDVYRFFQNIGYESLLSFQLARLCIKVNFEEISGFGIICNGIFPNIPEGSKYSFIPQGAPTSPMLSNIIMYSFDDQLENIAQKYSLRCTRYSDDITFSSECRIEEKLLKEIINKVNNILSEKFKMNKSKQRVYHKGQRMIVTGLNINDKEPKLLKEFKNNLRFHAYYINKFGFIDHAKNHNFDPFSFYNHFNGCLIWAKYVEPDFGNKIEHMISNVDKPLIFQI